jgi:hypothetical protein
VSRLEALLADLYAQGVHTDVGGRGGEKKGSEQDPLKALPPSCISLERDQCRAGTHWLIYARALGVGEAAEKKS